MHPDHHHRDSRDDGWAGIVNGAMGDRDYRIAATGGWASDTRSIWRKVVDMLALYALVGAFAVGTLTLVYWFVRL